MIYFLIFFFITISSKKLVLIGGNLGTSGQIFTQIGRLTGRNLSPNKCDENWQTTTCPRIAVITSAAASESAGNSAYTKDQPNDPSYYTLFKQNGFTSRHISAHIDNYQKAVNLSSAQGVLNLNIIQLADIIFFNGGDQARHARTWLLDNGTPNPMFSKLLVRYNNNQVVISGTSAGTMIMSNPTYGEGISFGHLYFNGKIGLAQKSTKDGAVNGSGLADVRNGTKGLQYQDNGGKMPGFTVFNNDFIFDSHFDARGRLTRLIPGLHDMKKSYGIGVDQNTAIYLYDNDYTLKGSVWGQNGVWIVNNKNAHYNITNYFQVSNVYLWYLTAGDSIDLSNFTIHSSKSQITQPYYNESINSTRIQDSYETTKLITHLVDQTQNHNIGITRTPSGYSKDTPLFQFTFSKIQGSKGYVSHDKYTVQKVAVSIKVVNHTQIQQ